MRTAIYNAPTGEDVPVVILVGSGKGPHQYNVRVSASVGPYQEGQTFDCAPLRLTCLQDDGNTLKWLAIKGRAGSARYVVSVPEMGGEVVVKQMPTAKGGAWRAHWPDGRYGCTRALAHETLKEAEGFIASAKKRQESVRAIREAS